MKRCAAILALVLCPELGDALPCPALGEVVQALHVPSPYQSNDASRSRVDPVTEKQVKQAIEPIDRLLRLLARQADQLEHKTQQAVAAQCISDHLLHWAEHDALGDMHTTTAEMILGARLAGLAMIYHRAQPYVPDASAAPEIAAWLERRQSEQISFWQENAATGAAKGNLRAWSSLAAWLIGGLSNRADFQDWAHQGLQDMLCHARADGSLPQEMRRGKYALHYQLHAIAPTVTTYALMAREGFDHSSECQGALSRVVNFAVSDLDEGVKSETHAGVRQSYFDGTESVEPHELAWGLAYLTLQDHPDLKARLSSLPGLRNSKLGGDQRQVWQEKRQD